MYDLLIRNGTLQLPDRSLATNLAITGGKIAGIGISGRAKQEFDAQGLHILPGIIDSQVHFREPGLEHKEDLATGTLAALIGGVTAVLEMPNTKPSTVTPQDLADKVTRTKGRASCHIGFFLGAAAENADQLAAWERAPACAGVKIFMGSSTGSLLVAQDEVLLRVLQNGRRRIAIHAEDEALLNERKKFIRPGDPSSHPAWRNAETALSATKRIVGLARKASRPLHILHLTTAEEVEFLKGHKDIASIEVTPQHLTLSAEDCYARLGSLAQMNPPIRSRRHQEALWWAVQQGLVDMIGSDHAPHTLEEKKKTYPDTPSGMPGVQTILPLMLDHVNAGRLSLSRLVDLMADSPARLYGIAGKGRIAVGYDADLTLVDLAAERVVEESWLKSRCGWSPFTGVRLKGWPMAVFLNGQLAMREGESASGPQGAPLRFWGERSRSSP